LNKRLQLLK